MQFDRHAERPSVAALRAGNGEDRRGTDPLVAGLGHGLQPLGLAQTLDVLASPVLAGLEAILQVRGHDHEEGEEDDLDQVVSQEEEDEDDWDEDDDDWDGAGADSRDGGTD